MKIIDILRKARDHITSRRMWIKGGFSLQGSDGALTGLPVCAEGAVMWACSTSDYSDEKVQIAIKQLGKDLPADRYGTFFPVRFFNDAGKCTHQDILNLFDQAISDLEPPLHPLITEALNTKETCHEDA